LDLRFRIAPFRDDPKSEISNPKISLFVLSVQRMAAAAATELFELKPVRRVLFVLCRHVIPLFALGALQNYVISRHFELPYSKFHIPNSRLF
jgi:hypothetical protein